MTVLVDTSVWSLALRRRSKAPSSSETAELAKLIGEGRASIIGPIRQELLSGVKDSVQFGLLRDRLRAFQDLKLDLEDYGIGPKLFDSLLSALMPLGECRS